MALRHLASLSVVLALCFAASGPLAAQKKGKPGPDRPATLTFSCTSSNFTNVICQNLDRVVGDTRNYPGTGTPETGQGAFLREINKELWLGFGAGVYKLLLDFTERADIAPCSLNNNCQFNTNRFPNNLMLADVEDGEIQSNIVAEPGGIELPNGLLGVDGSAFARLKINFADPLDGALWTVRFNALEYAGSNEIPVTRIDSCNWLFESDGDDDDNDGTIEPLAGLSKAGRRSRTDEGLFVLRFSMTLRVGSLCQ